MRIPLLIAVWLSLFSAWLWIMDRVSREFWFTGKADVMLSLTFYTGGVFGVLALLGRQNRSALLAGWVESVLEKQQVADGPQTAAGWDRLIAFKNDLMVFIARVLGDVDARRARPRDGDVRASRRSAQDETTSVDTGSEPAEGGPGTGPVGSWRPPPAFSILELIVRKAEEQQVERIWMVRDDGRLRVEYETGSVRTTDRVLAEELRGRLLDELKAGMRPAAPAESGAGAAVFGLSVAVEGTQFSFEVVITGADETEEIVLKRMTCPGET